MSGGKISAILLGLIAAAVLGAMAYILFNDEHPEAAVLVCAIVFGITCFAAGLSWQEGKEPDINIDSYEKFMNQVLVESGKKPIPFTKLVYEAKRGDTITIAVEDAPRKVGFIYPKEEQ